ncbi:hypothetical protein RHMOL_Rhmol12G0097500 [Rhododendron molle]|uniref:Uncharacterized protein n=1 Tax=Rhododendron molle TaxID=49168 RepID=A0ACC0LHI4_RHOML|nr:hypothetical protein RHMOL_Rhmol12G0097500 [Rhododendron molle]
MPQLEWIMEQWEKNYYINSIAGANDGSSLVVMSKGIQYSQQSYKVSDSFPFKWINKKWRDGFHVTSMATAGTRWAVVMSRNAGCSDLVELLFFNFVFVFSLQRLGYLAERRLFRIQSLEVLLLLGGVTAAAADAAFSVCCRYEYYYALARSLFIADMSTIMLLRFTINGGINGINEEVSLSRKPASCSLFAEIPSRLFQNMHLPVTWNIVGHVDSAVYGAPQSNVTHRQVLEKYQVYANSVARKYGERPSVREVVKAGGVEDYFVVYKTI